jgi:hypothetical protein
MDAMVGSDEASTGTISRETCAGHLKDAESGFVHIVALSEVCQKIHRSPSAEINDPLGSLLEAIKVLARDKSHEIYDLINDTRSGCYDS